MRFRVLRLLPLAAATMAGCASGPSLARPDNSLDRAIRYEEITSRGKEIALSSSAPLGLGVPKDTEVDTNSSIRISLQKDAVEAPGDSLAAAPSVKTVEAKAGTLRPMLEALANVIEAREKALEAYKATAGMPLTALSKTAEYKKFNAARDWWVK